MIKNIAFFIVVSCIFADAYAVQLYNCYLVSETRLDKYIDVPVDHPIYATVPLVENVGRQDAARETQKEIESSDDEDNLLAGYFCFPVEKDGGPDSPAGQFINNLHNVSTQQKNTLFPLDEYPFIE